MKKTIFSNILSSGRNYVIALLVLCSASSFAAAPRTVNANTMASFKSEFANASNIQWNVTPDYYMASFTQRGEDQQAFYTTDGNLYCTTKQISLSALPANATTVINKKFNDYKALQAIEMNTEDEGTAYYVSLENQKTSLILKVSKEGDVSTFKKTAK